MTEITLEKFVVLFYWKQKLCHMQVVVFVFSIFKGNDNDMSLLFTLCCRCDSSIHFKVILAINNFHANSEMSTQCLFLPEIFCPFKNILKFYYDNMKGGGLKLEMLDIKHQSTNQLELLLNKSLEIEYTMWETMRDDMVVRIVSSYVSVSFITYFVNLMSTHDQVHLMQLYVILFVSYGSFTVSSTH